MYPPPTLTKQSEKYIPRLHSSNMDDSVNYNNFIFGGNLCKRKQINGHHDLDSFYHLLELQLVWVPYGNFRI